MDGEKMVAKINLKQKANAVAGLFDYLPVGYINGHMLSVLQGENRTLDFHVHDNSDELFYCIEGAFAIELEDGLIDMQEGDLIIIPQGVRHRPICTGLVKCLLMEKEGTLNTDNTGGAYRA